MSEPAKGWTADEAIRQLEESGYVWNLGQLSPAAIRALDKAGIKHRRAQWPWFFAGTCQKTAWLHPSSPLAKATPETPEVKP